jgi:hypothetical protein|tara:strand:+ start:244 stop:393 length:150 start_codon:yes stop_codon:yes gene_type:complete
MLSINRIFVGTFLMGVLWSAFSINPLITGIVIGVLYGLTDLAREQGRIK